MAEAEDIQEMSACVPSAGRVFYQESVDILSSQTQNSKQLFGCPAGSVAMQPRAMRNHEVPAEREATDEHGQSASGDDEMAHSGGMSNLLLHTVSWHGDILDRYSKHVQLQTHRSEWMSCFSSNRPLSALFTLWPIRIITFGLGIVLFWASVLVFSYEDMRPDAIRMLRFTAVGLREPNLPTPTSVNLRAFGLLLNGCPVSHANTTTTLLSNTTTLTFANPLTFDGVYLVSASASPEVDPVRFTVETSVDGRTWQTIVTSLRRHRCGCSRSTVLPADLQQSRDAHMHFPQGREETMHIVFDRVGCLAPYYWWTAAQFNIGFGMILAPVVAVVHDYDLKVFDLSQPVRVLGYSALVTSTVRMVGYIYLMQMDLLAGGNAVLNYSHTEMIFELLLTLVYPGLLMIQWFEQFSIELGLIYGISKTLVHFLSGHSSLFGPALTVINGLLWALRTRARYAVKSEVRLDVQQYEKEWACMLARPGNQAALYQLKHCEERIGRQDRRQVGLRRSNVPVGVAVQLDSSAAEGSASEASAAVGSASASAETLDAHVGSVLDSPSDVATKGNPTRHINGAGLEGRGSASNGDTVIDVKTGRHVGVRRQYLIEHRSAMLSAQIEDLMSAREARPSRIRSLDQLYSQAASLEHVFRAKVLSIAALCNGQLSARSGEGAPVRLKTIADIKGGAGGVASIQWVPLKHVQRAVVKACVLYNGDMSCVCDLVRQRIVFEGVQEISECLAVLAEDPDLEIVKIRNLLDPQLQAWENNGYRDVAVLVRLVTPATRWLGVAVHVCELQLAHVDMMKLQTADKHERYLRFASVALSSQRVSILLDARLGFTAWLQSLNILKRAQLFLPRICSQLARIFTPASSSNAPVPSLVSSVTRQRLENSDWGAQGVVDYEQLLHREGIQSKMCYPEELDPSIQDLVSMRAFNMVRVRNSLPGGFLDQRLNQVRHGVQDADATMVLFTRPIGAISKAPILLIILIAGIYFAVDFFGSNGKLAASAKHSVFEARHMRFTVLATRSPELVQDPVSISKFGALLHGCEVELAPGYIIELKHHSSSIFLSLVSLSQVSPALFKANGYSLTTHASAGLAGDPVRWVVHWSSHQTKQPQSIPETDWILQAASGCVFGLNDLGCLPRPAIRYQLSDVRNKLHKFDLSSPWFMYVGTLIVYLPIVFGCLLGALVGIMGFTEGSRALLAINFWVPGVLEVVTALGMIMHDRDYPQTSSLLTLYWWVLGVSSMVFGGIIQFKDMYFTHYIPFHFLLTLVGLNVHNKYIIRERGFEVPFSPAITFIFWIVFLLSRQRVLRRTVNTIRADKDCYDMAWKAVAEQPEQLAACMQLDSITQEFDVKARPQQRMPFRTSAWSLAASGSLDSMSAMTPLFMPDSHNLEVVAGNPWFSTMIFTPTLLNQTPRICSLDQLYIQAAVLEPLFLDKVNSIAQASSGMFLFRNQSSGHTSSNNVVSTSEVIAGMEGDALTHTHTLSLSRTHTPGGQLIRYVSWDDPQHVQRMRSGQGILIKSVDRIIEKLTRSYHGDVAVILDLVRQCIVFDTVTDILGAIQFMCKDPDIQVHRIKNRLSTSYDASLFGYRDILVNCCITSKTARQLRLSGHVCELQLILRQFMDHRTLEGHQRYVEFRNMRCE